MWMVLGLIGFLGLLRFLIKEKRYRWFYIIYKSLPRDIRGLTMLVKLNRCLSQWEKNNMTVAKIFTQTASRHPHKVAYYFEEEIWTFNKGLFVRQHANKKVRVTKVDGDYNSLATVIHHYVGKHLIFFHQKIKNNLIEEYTNRVANYFKEEGFSKGDKVALLLESRPEYVCLWLGLSKIGVVTALINTNLTNDPLVHSINAANSKAIIFGSDFAKAVSDILPKVASLKLYEFHERVSTSAEMLEGAKDLKFAIDTASLDPSMQSMKQGEIRDNLLYIYTSGTTGLPKAAVITNLRFLLLTMGMHVMGSVRSTDCIYNSLPLYHTAGGVCGVGQALIQGVTVVLFKKFSASNFWKDCIKYKCTVAQYIGEICRYLLIAHGSNPSPKHDVRTLIGNGLKPQIWQKLVKTFGINEIREFYGATEGNSNLFNIDSTPGAVGFVPRYGEFIYPVALIKWDEKSSAPVRTNDGLCVRCKVNEPGILIGKIQAKRALNQFSGYADQTANEKKILRNVFRKGDSYFNTGDVLMCDELGYYYFKDRTGDTFRWKGENVSTFEVEAVISNVVGLNDAAVYGVEVPGNEGKVGMAAIVDLDDSLNLEQLCKGLKANLPAYAQPLFLRVMKSVPLTGTYKLMKGDLQEEGYDMNLVKDSLLYFYDAKQGKYVDLNRELYDIILSGNLRF